MLQSYLSAAGAHTELSLLPACQEGNKHLFVPQDSNSNSFVEGQKDGLQGRGSTPAPLTSYIACIV